MTFLFESGPIFAREKPWYAKIEITYQDVRNAEWANGLSPLDWSSPINCGMFPFTINERTYNVSPEGGIMGTSNMSVEAYNGALVTDGANVASGDIKPGIIYKNMGYTNVAYNSVSYANGQYFTGTAGVTTYTTTGSGALEQLYTVWHILTKLSSYDYAVHLRYSTKDEGGSYTIKYQGIVENGSIEAERQDPNDIFAWAIKFDVVDGINQLTKRTVLQWTEETLPRSTYDYRADEKYLTFIGTSPFPTANQPGRYLLERVLFNNGGTDGAAVWTSPDINGFPLLNTSLIPFRWIKLTDILQSMSNYLGYELPINGGGSWSEHFSWVFYHNEGNSIGSGGENLQPSYIGDLFVLSAQHYGTPSPTYWAKGTFFDYHSGAAGHSFFSASSPYEVLKRVCESLGMFARSRVDSNGDRFIELTELGKPILLSIPTFSGVQMPIKQVYNSKTLNGVNVTSPTGRDTKRGAGSDGNSMNVACLFTTANNSRATARFRQKVVEDESYLGARVCVLDADADEGFLTCLWVPRGNVSNRNYDRMYTICAVAPKLNNTAAASEPGNIPPWGEFIDNRVQYPNRGTPPDPFNCWTEIPAMALAHYLFNDVPASVDPVGIYKPHGSEFEITLNNFSHDEATLYPPVVITITMAGVPYEILCHEVEYDDVANTVTYKGFTRE